MAGFEIGLQLYSVRDEMERDMAATLKAVAEMGYTCVEFAGYFGKSAEEVRALCDKYRLRPVSVHQKHEVFLTEPEESTAYLRTLGVKYAAIPWISPERWQNEYETLCGEIRTVGKLLRENGMQLLYHNHDFEFFVKRGEDCLLDALYKELPSDILAPQLDLCWVHYAGQDPVQYVEKYGNVIETLHIKDFVCKNLAAGPVYALIDEKGKAQEEKRDKESDGFAFRAIGHGRQDMPAIMHAAEKTKVRYIIVEQDAPTEGKTTLEDARDSIEYLRSIGY